MDDSRKQPPAVQQGNPQPAATRPRRTTAGQDAISAGLRALWAALEDEPVPDDFLKLLDQIEAGQPLPATPTPEPDSGSVSEQDT
ncbi:NepR family anti-sigma factor [Sandarakinorhabdus sp.]|uniref:NepR family anti-sigma factor n=1 Tax=Sandarakinorhabdus sp. TaxID=1916663 RepID=UPI00356831FD